MEQIDEDTIALHWTTEDVMHECDWLSKDQARHVLSQCLHKHDANHGAVSYTHLTLPTNREV